MKILPDISLSKHTTFRTGGNAMFFAEPESLEELQEIISRARSEGLSFLILGEGSNVLMPDDGFPGYVIVPKILGIEFSDGGENFNETLVVAGAGVHWDDLVAETVSKNLSGLENLSWIPGSVGAAPVQNIGAYGAEIKDCLEWVEVLDANQLNEKTSLRKLPPEECQFEYRDSFFKSVAGGSLVITRVAFRLKKNGMPNISYKDLANFFADKTAKGEYPTVAEVRNAVIAIRQAKLPDVTKLGTAGSFFKNPIISESEFVVLAKKFPGIPSFAVAASAGAGSGSEQDFKKIPLAWVLDKVCGLNGFREGNVGLFETQPLALVNFGGATTGEIKSFAQKISDIVREKTNLNIQWEVNEINFKK